jgi:uncharacterized protein (TIGR04206 family)
MAWVKSEYAGEFAVLSTWLVALLPWSTTVMTIQFRGTDATVVVIRFLYFRLQYIFGISFGSQERPFLLFTDAVAFNPESLALASWLWVTGAVLSIAPVGLSIAYYGWEDRVDFLAPVDPVRLQGVLVGLVGLVLLTSTAEYMPVQNVTVPVGALFALVFAFLLLTVDRA